jgi:putative transposase
LFDPAKHHRRSIRLREHDYASEGWYFVTICTHGRKCTLASVVDDAVVLSELGRLVEKEWLDLPNRFPMVELGAHVVMPNHLHGIITIVYQCNPRVAGNPRIGANEDPMDRRSPINADRPRGTTRSSLSSIMQSFKSETTKAIRKITGRQDTMWQRNYFEEIVKSYKALAAITVYINENPIHWHKDAENPNNRYAPNDR